MKRHVTIEDIHEHWKDFVAFEDAPLMGDGMVEYYAYAHLDGTMASPRDYDIRATAYADISEWADDDDPGRLWEEWETLRNPDYRDLCEELAEKINEELEELEEDEDE